MVIKTLFFTIITSLILIYIGNHSNFPSTIIVPIITALLVKYSLGDWDKGYRYTRLDIVYWMIILLTSYLCVYLLGN
jgi:hypothetical protein